MLAAAALFLLLSPARAAGAAAQPALWCWLGGDMAEAAAQVRANADIVTDVSFGGFALGDDGALVPSKAGLNTTANALFRRLGIRTHIEVFADSGASGSIEAMRKLFANPEPFITAAVEQAVLHNFSGYNIDLEPYAAAAYPWRPTATAEDGVSFARFVDALSRRLHEKGKVVSVDFFSSAPATPPPPPPPPRTRVPGACRLEPAARHLPAVPCCLTPRAHGQTTRSGISWR